MIWPGGDMAHTDSLFPHHRVQRVGCVPLSSENWAFPNKTSHRDKLPGLDSRPKLMSERKKKWGEHSPHQLRFESSRSCYTMAFEIFSFSLISVLKNCSKTVEVRAEKKKNPDPQS
jgi:hypothetical protein